MKIELSPDQEFITVTIPIGFKRRGSRRLIIAPDVSITGEAPTPPRPTRDDKLIQAIARAFQWQEWIENGKYADTHDLAAKIKVERSYVSRVVRLTLLAPDIIESILDGTQPRDLTLQQLIRGFPRLWREQRQLFGFPEPKPSRGKR